MYNNQFMQPQFNNMQYQQYQQSGLNNIQQQLSQQNSLQGKPVDSVDVVKSMDIPLNGSISYFPLVDGSAIVTKQLQKDGTSKIIVYKQIEMKEENKPEYLTRDDLSTYLKDFSLDEVEDIKDDINDLKKAIKNLKKEK